MKSLHLAIHKAFPADSQDYDPFETAGDAAVAAYAWMDENFTDDIALRAGVFTNLETQHL